MESLQRFEALRRDSGSPCQGLMVWLARATFGCALCQVDGGDEPDAKKLKTQQITDESREAGGDPASGTEVHEALEEGGAEAT